MANQIGQPVVSSVTGGVSGGGGATGQIRTATTHPPEALRHNISDDELTRLSEGNDSAVGPAFWTFFGGVIGSAPAAWRAYSNGFSGNQALTVDSQGLLDIVIFAVVSAVAAALFFVNRSKKKQQKPLVSEIRSRPKSY